MTDHKERLKTQMHAAIHAHRADPDPLHTRLLNWARWCRTYPAKAISCRSIEHRYRSPQCWYPLEPKTEIDELDAVVIEKTIGMLPDFVRIALAAHYVYGGRHEKNERSRRNACVDIGINWSKYGEAIQRAEKMLANRLTVV